MVGKISSERGRLSLVSVGIGDRENMTIKAAKAIEEADVVFAMKFIRNELSDLLKGKEVHDAGHAFFTGAGPNHDSRLTSPVKERETVRIIRDAISAGRNIVVLDFGDPTLFSPQAGYLIEFADLSPDVVPGISSVGAASAFLKRELSGHFDRPIAVVHGIEEHISDEQLGMLAASGATMAFFAMGMKLERLVERLRTWLHDDTPAVLVFKAGYAENEKAIFSTLAEIVRRSGGKLNPHYHILFVGQGLGRGDNPAIGRAGDQDLVYPERMPQAV